jgi:hypothetical protein
VNENQQQLKQAEEYSRTLLSKIEEYEAKIVTLSVQII